MDSVSQFPSYMPGHISWPSSILPTRQLKILYSGMNHFEVRSTPAGTSQFLKFITEPLWFWKNLTDVQSTFNLAHACPEMVKKWIPTFYDSIHNKRFTPQPSQEMKNPNHHKMNTREGNKVQANVNWIQAVISQGPSMDGQCNTPRLHTLHTYFLNKIMQMSSALTELWRSFCTEHSLKSSKS